MIIETLDTKATSTEESNLYSDATLIVYNSKNMPKVNVQFKDMFPTSLSSLEYSQDLHQMWNILKLVQLLGIFITSLKPQIDKYN